MSQHNALALHSRESIRAFDTAAPRDPNWERLWLSTLERSWRSLALVAAGPGAPLDFTVQVAMRLADTGMAHLSQQIHVADATTLSLQNNAEFLTQLRLAMSTGPVIIALAPCLLNPVTTPLARTANGAILCAKLGHTKMRDARETVNEIGRQHFIGAASFE